MKKFNYHIIRTAKELNFLFNPIVTIKSLNIEFNSSCNLRCRMCSLDHTKQRQIISKKTLKKVIKDISINRYWLKIDRIDLHNAGETLLHPEIIELLEIIGLAKEKYSFFPKVSLLTNTTLLSKGKSEQIIKSKAIDTIRFSIDGGNKEYFEKIRYPAKWEVVLNNVEQFVEINKKSNNPVSMEIICMSHPNNPFSGIPGKENLSYMDPKFLKLTKEVKTEFRNPHNWDGSKKLEINIKKNKRKKGLCMFIYDNLVILPNGDITLCCADLNSRGVFGNIKQKSLFRLCHSIKRKKTSLKMFLRKRERIYLCKNCTIGMNNSFEDKY